MRTFGEKGGAWRCAGQDSLSFPHGYHERRAVAAYVPGRGSLRARVVGLRRCSVCLDAVVSSWGGSPVWQDWVVAAESKGAALFAHMISGFAGPDDVDWTEAEEPADDGGVVIDVIAAGVSFADLLQTTGAYQMKMPLPYVPGMEAAGVVRFDRPEFGLGAGQRVAVLLSYGCWQEVLSAPPERILSLPDDLGFEAAAATPLNYLTGLFALVTRAQARAGETLLVHGGAGGVGTAAIQLGHALGLRTVAVVGDEAKRAFALRCGADHAVLHRGWLAAVHDLVGERAVDIVLDPVGGDRMTDSLRSLALEGRLVVVGFAAGEIPTVKVNRLLLANTAVIGAASREFFEQHPASVADLWGRLIDLRQAALLPDPPVQAYPFADARSALRAIAQRKVRGKVVLSREV